MISILCLAVFILLLLFAYTAVRLLWACRDRYDNKYNAYWENRNREDRHEAIIDRVFNALRGRL